MVWLVWMCNCFCGLCDRLVSSILVVLVWFSIVCVLVMKVWLFLVSWIWCLMWLNSWMLCCVFSVVRVVLMVDCVSLSVVVVCVICLWLVMVMKMCNCFSVIYY